MNSYISDGIMMVLNITNCATIVSRVSIRDFHCYCWSGSITVGSSACSTTDNIDKWQQQKNQTQKEALNVNKWLCHVCVNVVQLDWTREA